MDGIRQSFQAPYQEESKKRGDGTLEKLAHTRPGFKEIQTRKLKPGPETPHFIAIYRTKDLTSF
jgi:hypothetical protein